MVSHRSHIFFIFFHCFSIVLLDIIFPFITLGIILPSPYSFHRFHCFPIFFPLFYVKVPPFFHCFSHHFPLLSHFFPIVLSLFFPPFPLLSHFFPLFYVKVLPFFHGFSHHFPLLSHFFPIVLCPIPSFFLLFVSSFSPPLQSAQIHLGGRTRGESIPQRHPIATWYITLKKFNCVHLFYHLFSSFLSNFGRSAPRPP